MSEPRKPFDWEAIEREYRAGILSIREIGRLHGVSDTAIRKQARANGWERDLAEKVRQRAADKLVRSLGSREGSQEQRANDNQIIEDSALVIVALVRDHRRDIGNGRQAVRELFAELREATENRNEIEQAIEVETADDANGRRRATMLRAVSLPTRAATAANLAVALKNLVGIERTAFGLEGEDDKTVRRTISSEPLTPDEWAAEHATAH